MSQSLPPSAHPLPETVVPVASQGVDELDQRILAIEHRLIAREEGLHRHVLRLRQRLPDEARRLLGPSVVVLSALAGMFFLGRSRHRPPHGAAPATADTGASWARYVGLAWPMLPERWRARVSPTTAITVLSLLAPTLERALARRPTLPPLNTVPVVDLDRYGGLWYVVAQLPARFASACQGQATVEYRRTGQRAGGLPRSEVVNRCVDASGRPRCAQGVARAMRGGGGARLKVSQWPAGLHWLPMAWVDHWILHLDDDYTEALVGDPQRRFLQVLSRQPDMPLVRLNALLAQAQQQGFDVTRVVYAQR